MKPSSAWSSAFHRLFTEVKTERAALSDTGEWVVSLVGNGSWRKVLPLLPGHWELLGARDTEEVTSTVFACREERAVASFADHWQAGVFGSVVVYPDARRFEVGLVEALKTCTYEFAYEEWLLALSAAQT